MVPEQPPLVSKYLAKLEFEVEGIVERIFLTKVPTET